MRAFTSTSMSLELIERIAVGQFVREGNVRRKTCPRDRRENRARNAVASSGQVLTRVLRTRCLTYVREVRTRPCLDLHPRRH